MKSPTLEVVMSVQVHDDVTTTCTVKRDSKPDCKEEQRLQTPSLKI